MRDVFRKYADEVNAEKAETIVKGILKQCEEAAKQGDYYYDVSEYGNIKICQSKSPLLGFIDKSLREKGFDVGFLDTGSVEFMRISWK